MPCVKRVSLDAAIDYEQGLKVVEWWLQGHFNAAMIFGKLHVYNKVINHMKEYLMLAPPAPNVRAAQDQIYTWQGDSQAMVK